MTADQRDAINTPTTGLMVYVTDAETGVWVYGGASWRKLAFA